LRASDIVGRTIKLNGNSFHRRWHWPKDFKGLYAVFGPESLGTIHDGGAVLPSSLQQALTDRATPLFTGIAALRWRHPAPGPGGDEIDAAALETTSTRTSIRAEHRCQALTIAAYGPERQGLMFGAAFLMAIVGLVLLIACSMWLIYCLLAPQSAVKNRRSHRARAGVAGLYVSC